MKLGLGSLGERTERESREAGELEIAGGTGESGREEVGNGQTGDSREALERNGNASLAPPQEVSRGTGRVFGTGQNSGGKGRGEETPGDTGKALSCPGPASGIYLVPRAADDGRENGPGGIVPGKARLDQPRAVVAHQCGGLLVVAHLRKEART